MKGFLLAVLLTAAVSEVRAERGTAVVKGTEILSTIEGIVSFEEGVGGLKVTARFTGLPPGKHAFHVHEFGICGDAGKAAGGHFNPKGSPHGFLPKDGPQGAHAGDMGSITAGTDGSASLEIVLPDVALSKGDSNLAGRAVVVHEKADDLSQPSGGAGARIGCGSILVTGS